MRKITNPSDPTLTKYYFSDDEIDLILSEGDSDDKKNNNIDINKEFDEIELFLNKKSNSSNFSKNDTNKTSKSNNSDTYFDVEAEQQKIDELLGIVKSTSKNHTSNSTKKDANIKHIIVQIENLLETLRQQL